MPLVFPTLLYAETHYRFKYFFSLLKKREPEILADLPHRLEPTAILPILLLVKDAHLYPIELTSVSISIHCETTGKIVSQNILSEKSEIHTPFWWKVISVSLEEYAPNFFGFLSIDVFFEYKRNNKFRRCTNDNYRTSSKRSYRVFRSADPLPSFPGWVQGDTHTHSFYTNDQVEFGPPIEGSVELCKAMGLSFFCVTDHSYDLDDRVDNYLENDTALPKWESLQNEISTVNKKRIDFAVVRGEEVSVWNQQRRNVHLLLWGTRKYFPGSGDSAERWFRTNAEFTINNILHEKEPAVVAYAAHPTENVPLLQKLLLRRGEWRLPDMSDKNLNGIQILNGEADEAFDQGLTLWKQLLLKGKRIFIAAGNDAHGNFNRFKQIKIPFVKIIEADKQLFGKMRTALLTNQVSEDSILNALRTGNSVITNGPLVIFEIKQEISPERNQHRLITIFIHGKSSQEFGGFTNCTILAGRVGDEAETLLWKIDFKNDFSFELEQTFYFQFLNAPNYVRAEAFTRNGTGIKENGFCYTNPLWLD